MNRVYVYALADASRRTARIGGRRIEFIPVGTMHAAIERLPAPPQINETALRAQHDVVVALARRCDAILPARFGAWVDAAELERIVRSRDRTLRRALDRVRQKEQMTVRIFGGQPSRRVEESPGTTGTAYLRARSAAANLPPEAAWIRRAVRPLVAAERVDPGRGRMRAALHHLVERGAGGEYTTLVNHVSAARRIQDDVVVSGPWPPFAFAPDIWS